MMFRRLMFVIGKPFEKDSLCQAFFGAIWNERKTR